MELRVKPMALVTAAVVDIVLGADHVAIVQRAVGRVPWQRLGRFLGGFLSKRF